AHLARGMRPLLPVLVLALALGGLAFAVQTGRSALGPVGAVLGAWVVFGALTDLALRTGRGSIGARLGRLARLPRADWGKSTAHAGLGITLFAVCAMNAWAIEDIRTVPVGGSFPLGAYEITLVSVNQEQGPNYSSTVAEMTAARGGRVVATVHPEKRVYAVQGMPTTEAGIDYGLLRDIYLVIGDPQDDGSWAVRSYVKPFANWLWGGAIIMALGGLLSLSDRRYRVAAGSRRVAATAVAAE
ncbi:MAG: heme lyase NrfEFG subunit NrfE, partial [Rhodobacterales bacterium]|nr:heme lyase NrfEFG subunit NrfE [Rhodobacterales bacterium]